MAKRFSSKEWKAIEKTPADGTVRWASMADGDARVSHLAADRMHAETMLAESPIDGTLWRRIRKPEGSWTHACAVTDAFYTDFAAPAKK